jgi:ABC-2 type transport system permease protein
MPSIIFLDHLDTGSTVLGDLINVRTLQQAEADTFATAADERSWTAFQGFEYEAKLALRHRRGPCPPHGGSGMIGNSRGVWSLYCFEMARFGRTVWTSLLLPVVMTCLYFVVFGSAIGSRMTEIDGIAYGAFIEPSLMILTMFTESINNASFGIYLPKWIGTIYEMLSAPMSRLEMVIAYVGAAASKSILIGCIILAMANLFVDVQIAHPFLMALFMVLVVITFCLFGFIIGIWAKSFEQL